MVNNFQTYRQNEQDKLKLLDLIKSETFGKPDDWRLIETTSKHKPATIVSTKGRYNHDTLEKIKAGLSSHQDFKSIQLRRNNHVSDQE